MLFYFKKLKIKSHLKCISHLGSETWQLYKSLSGSNDYLSPVRTIKGVKYIVSGHDTIRVLRLHPAEISFNVGFLQ